MNNRLGIMVVPLAMLLSGCPELGQRWDDRTQQLDVDYFREPCNNDSQSLCYRVRESDKDAFTRSDTPWQGFDAYTWGSRYRAEVITSFASDGSPSGYNLQRVISSSDESSEAFSLTLHSRSGVLQPSGAEWLLGAEILMDCGTDCTALTSAVNAGDVVRLELQVVGTSLVLNELLCRDSEEDFAATCGGESDQSWQVASFMSDCGLLTASMCLLYRTDSSSAFERLVLEEGIEGFSYQWGQRYDLDVRQTLSPAGVLQAARLIADDDSPLSQNGSANRFRFIVRGAELAVSSGDRVALYGGSGVASNEMPALDCGTNALCATLNQYISDEEFLLLRAHYDDAGETLILEDIHCHDAELASFRSCVGEYSDVNWPI